MSKPPLRTEIEFNRPKKYKTVRELGNGACGETVLIHDDEMDIDLVVKKYCPSFGITPADPLFRELMVRFKGEARILFQLNHPNIVRVYNFFDYEEHGTSYIIMEYVQGSDIASYIATNPLNFDAVFEKTISGFEHLESKGIVHRDIRPANLLVSDSGEPKIIDFGFGKQFDISAIGLSKSVTLNWCFDTPPEFAQSIYDSQTEVYFVGKLFEHALTVNSLSGSKYVSLIQKMCLADRAQRFENFRDVYNEISKERFDELKFNSSEIAIYRKFAGELASAFSEINPRYSYEKDVSIIMDRLEELHSRVMLEEHLPSPAALCRIFVRSAFSFYPTRQIEVSSLKSFLDLLRRLTGQKREIVVANIFSRLDAVKRSHPTQDLDDEIPF